LPITRDGKHKHFSGSLVIAGHLKDGMIILHFDLCSINVSIQALNCAKFQAGKTFNFRVIQIQMKNYGSISTLLDFDLVDEEWVEGREAEFWETFLIKK
jgi:hypothetical protein